MTPTDVTALRAALNLNPLELAERLGVPPRLVLQWESGDRFPTKKHCEHLRRLLDAGAQPTRTVRSQETDGPTRVHATRPLDARQTGVIVAQLLGDPEFERRLRALVSDYLGSSSEKSGSEGVPHSGPEAGSGSTPDSAPNASPESSSVESPSGS